MGLVPWTETPVSGRISAVDVARREAEDQQVALLDRRPPTFQVAGGEPARQHGQRGAVRTSDLLHHGRDVQAAR
ncbi:hypothetical protein SVIOM74S_09909 [Streptomyces violarus]